MICAGIDGGSRAIKAVVFDAAAQCVLASAVCDQGVASDRLAAELFDRVLASAGLSRGDVAQVVATGYTRNRIGFAHATITEITCHAAGVRFQVADAMTVVEIGGQDSKLLRLDEGGAVRDFAMNDRCAAGTGRFLEVVPGRLDVRLADLGELAARSHSPAAISSTCVVFAETEIIGLLASGAARHDIVAGVQLAIAHRLAAMAGRGLEAPIVFTGGVALVPGMARALETALGQPVRIAPIPQITGALGAAILASRRISPTGRS